MKNWEVVYTIITGTIFSRSFDTLDELLTWLGEQAEDMRPITKTLTVWELYDGDYKKRYSWRA